MTNKIVAPLVSLASTPVKLGRGSGLTTVLSRQASVGHNDRYQRRGGGTVFADVVRSVPHQPSILVWAG